MHAQALLEGGFCLRTITTAVKRASVRHTQPLNDWFSHQTGNCLPGPSGFTTCGHHRWPSTRQDREWWERRAASFLKELGLQVRGSGIGIPHPQPQSTAPNGWDKCKSHDHIQQKQKWEPGCVHVKLLSRVWISMTPWTVACQAPLSMGFSRQEPWSGLPYPSPGAELASLMSPALAEGFFTIRTTWETRRILTCV